MRDRRKYLSLQIKGDDSGITILVIDNNITHWKGFINGSPDTPYEGGYF